MLKNCKYGVSLCGKENENNLIVDIYENVKLVNYRIYSMV